MNDYEELIREHIELCEFLHNHMEDFPTKLQEELSDKIYSRYEP